MALSRLTLPGAFYDRTSQQMLVAPEPEYLYAKLVFAANAKMELRDTEIPLTAFQVPVSASGGILPPEAMNDPVVNASWPLADAIQMEDFQGKGVGPGQTVRFPRQIFTDSTYTKASRNITRAVVGTTPVDIEMGMAELTIQRYGGPYAGSAVGPYVIESFDLQNKSEIDLSRQCASHLRRDRVKFLDSVVGDLYCSGASSSTGYVYPGDYTDSLTSDATAFLAQGTRPMDMEALVRAERRAVENKIPTFTGGRYVCILSPRQAQQLLMSRAFRDASQFIPEKNLLTSSYVRSIGRTDIYIGQTNPTTTTGSITVQLGVLFGQGAVGAAVASACGVYPDSATNFDQRIMVIWRADEEYKVLDNRFLISIRSN